MFFNDNFIIGQEKSNFIKLSQTFDGNSNIIEDNLGYIWISNTKGLNKYNGYDFSIIPYGQVFEKATTKSDDRYLLAKDNLGNIWVSSYKGELIKIDSNGVSISYKESLNYNKEPLYITSIRSINNDIWFGSSNGVVFKYNHLISAIENVTVLPKINNSPQLIRSIAITNPEEIWVSTSNGFIYNYSLRLKSLKKIEKPLNDVVQNIRLVEDIRENLWIATNFHGLMKYNPKKNEFNRYGKLETKESNLNYAMFISVFCDSSGKIWAGTDGDGLYMVNPENDEVVIFKHEKTNNFSISNNTITHIYEDTHNNIWLVDKKGKINILPKNNEKIKYYNGLESNTSTKILSILESSDGSLWLGTDGHGLNRVFPDNSKIQYDESKKGKQFFKGKYIQNLEEDSNGNIWIATYRNGLWLYDNNLKTFSKIETKDSSGNVSEDVRCLLKDSKNRIWATNGVAINIFSKSQKLLAIYDYKSIGLKGEVPITLCESGDKSIWLGVNEEGLFKFNENSENLNNSYFTKYNYYIEKYEDINNYNIQQIIPDKFNHLWVLCKSGFLVKYNILDNSFESYAGKEGIKDISIKSVLIEEPNSLWLGSSNGIHNYNITSNILKSFHQVDGFQTNNFTKNSSFKSPNGTFYFGGEVGVNSFVPSNLIEKEISAKLYISKIEILNKPANLIIADQVKRGIEYVDELKLKSNQSSFSFQFSAVNNLLNSNYHYAYKLNGFDKNWIVPNKERIATYTNIPYGNYVFEVKAGVKKGEWNIDSRKINISIKAPGWLSFWAFVIYAFVSLSVGFAIFNWFRLRSSLAKEEWQNNKEKELYALKMNFFAKMSHEIQTPLTLILGPIEDMLSKADGSGNNLLKQRLTIIKNNAKRLSRIATELITVRNKELGRSRVFASKNNLLVHLKKMAISFSEQARFKNIDFIEEYPEEEIFLWYDIDKIEHVFYNLLSNAFKFTPKEGNVKFKVVSNQNEDFVEILVINSGSGIPEEELEDIFKLFYQSNTGKTTRGSGIGLALTKELIYLHKGEISVNSLPDGNTIFTVKLSKKEDVFSDDEKILVDSSIISNELIKQSIEVLDNDFKNDTKNSTSKKYTILVVEDNIEMQMLLNDVLGKNYNVLIADNGVEGVKLAEQAIPDIILSDIMMPSMDGIEMCEILQKNRKTSHIPIILLTAKNTTKTKMRGLESGAIEFINKPFNFKELLIKISNIIEVKEKVIINYKAEISTIPKDDEVKSKDDIFIENLIKEINNEIDNPKFKLEELSSILNMSYSVIYRKCQEITGKTIIELVRSIKLKRAALLIVKHGYKISEAAYMVGYKDSKYFTKCFKSEFGKTPLRFKKEVKEIGLTEFLEKYNLHVFQLKYSDK
ncbi:hybrid sensor histidine kinase/response regulator [Lutibacter litoralis]|nr:hybrid sensor histidine kinase/response regulator [Lutibacter litoralis]